MADLHKYKHLYVDGTAKGEFVRKNQSFLLTVLFPNPLTRQLKYADLPTKAVTLLGIFVSKYGSFHFGFKNELNGGCVLLSVNVLYPSRGR